MKRLLLALLFCAIFSSTQAQDYNFTSEYNKLLWPVKLGVGGGLTGDDFEYKRLTLFHGHSIALQTGSNLPNNGYTRLYISGNGNVGIGTTSPTQKLQVAGNLLLDSDNQGSIIFTGTGTSELSRFMRLLNSPEHATASGLKAGGVLVADNYEFANPSKNDLIVKGKVSIGTAKTDAALTVAGNVHAKEVKVTVTAGADFVFDEAYQLPALRETEAYVKKHKHLPGIAPAKQMEMVGVNLGEMNILLLQKIEELTLHVIEQEKKLREQQHKVSELEAHLEVLKLENSRVITKQRNDKM